jgi:phage terminase small subunit
MGPLANQRHERFAQALAEGKTATEAYALAGYKANDGNASRMKGNERIWARVQEIVGRAAERAEVSLERVLPGTGGDCLFRHQQGSDEGPERPGPRGGRRTAGASRSSPALFRWCRATGSTQARRRRSRRSRRARQARRIKMHGKLAALVALGKHLGMDQRTQKTNVVYAISDKPMSEEEWVKRYVTPH